ncbi:hypothetical protein AB0383_50025 [Amycolatopsis sp. NPDC051373]|uniref:hypothetical protein n=1 Tax=Amycolatopsis sp. NPDC051373 TaxID=3155801 RepID=UPI00344DE795
MINVDLVNDFAALATAWIPASLFTDDRSIRVQIVAALEQATRFDNPGAVRVAGYVRLAEIVAGRNE